MKGAAFILVLSIALSGCVTNEGEWTKPGASIDDFNRDKYACLQQSQQPTSSMSINRYGGYGSSGVITNGGLYGACMNSRGWALMSISDTRAFNAEGAAASAPIQNACVSAEYRVLFSQKMPCKPNEATQAQMQDRSKVTAAERAQLLKWLDLIIESNERAASIHRKYNPKSGEVLAANIEMAVTETKGNVTQLSDGKITWGEFNRMRSSLAKRMDEANRLAILTN